MQAEGKPSFHVPFLNFKKKKKKRKKGRFRVPAASRSPSCIFSNRESRQTKGNITILNTSLGYGFPKQDTGK
jgi:hypothetical protein